VKLPLKKYLKHVYKTLFFYYRFFLQKRIVGRKKYIASIKRHFSENLSEIEYQTLVPKRKVKFNEIDKKFLDEDIDCNILIKKNKDKGYIQKEVFFCKLRNVKFFGHSGGLAIGKKPLLESTCTLTRLRNFTLTVDSILLKHRKMKGVYTSIMHIFNHVFYHFLIENIPRFYGISKMEESKINLIIPRHTPKWQFEILKIFLDDRFRLMTIYPNEVWHLEDFYFSSCWHIDCSSYIPKELVEFVRNKVFTYYGIKNKGKKRRLILSRAKMSTRRIKNREEFTILLKKYNFEEIHPQELSFKEQVEIFYSAEIVIGVAGSAFSNIIFSDNLKVIQIFPPDQIITHTMLFCKSLGFSFKYIIGYDENKRKDCKVELYQVEILIKELLGL